MRKVANTAMWALVFFGSAAFAQGPQNRDISFLAGPVPSTNQVIPNSDVSVSTATGLAFQLSFAYQIYSTAVVNLYFETPYAFSNPGRGLIRGASGSASNRSFFFTPGVRFEVQAQSRLFLYGMAGGGYAGFRRLKLQSGLQESVTASPTLRGVFDVGGGVDFRLSRLVSLRGEVRDFIGGSGLSGASGRHHILSLIGIALHF